MKDPVEIQALVNKAKRDLEMIRRQVRKFNDVLFFIKSLKLWHIPLNACHYFWYLWFTQNHETVPFTHINIENDLLYYWIQGEHKGKYQLSRVSRECILWEAKFSHLTKDWCFKYGKLSKNVLFVRYITHLYMDICQRV